MKKQDIKNYLKIGIAGVIFILFLIPLTHASSGGTIINDSVVWENQYGSLKVWPHTSYGLITHTQYGNLTWKFPATDLDFAFRFDFPITGKLWVLQNNSWVDKTSLLTHTEYNSKHYYWIKNVSFQTNQTIQVKWQYNVPAGSSGKWNLFAKRSQDSLSYALSNNLYIELDPWWDIGFQYKRTINLTNTHATENITASDTFEFYWDTQTTISEGKLEFINSTDCIFSTVYQDSTEIDRTLVSCNTTNTIITVDPRFVDDAFGEGFLNIGPGVSDLNFSIYYGNTSASNPSDNVSLNNFSSYTTSLGAETPNNPPSVVINSPLNQSYSLGDGKLDINASVVDDNDAFDTALAEINSTINETLTNSSGDHVALNYQFAEGNNNVRFWVNDSANNMNGSEQIFFTIEIPPKPTINNPENTTTNSDSFDFSFDEEISEARYSIDGNANISNTTLNQSWIGTFSGLSDGFHNLTVWANDTRGNGNQSVVRWWTRDTTGPVLNITSPENKTYTNSSSVPGLNFTNDSFIQSCKYSLNGAANISINPCINETSLNSIEGLNTLTFSASDSLGNENSTTRFYSVTSDVTLPTITITAPLNQSYSNNSIVAYEVSADEQISTWIYNKNGTNVTFSDTVGTLNFSMDGDGSYNVIFYAKDTSNLWNQSDVNITIDTTFPRLENESISDTEINERDSVTISFEVSDLFLESCLVEINVSGTLTNFTATRTNTSCSLTRSGDDTDVIGTYNVTALYINDTAENLNKTFSSLSYTVVSPVPSSRGGGLSSGTSREEICGDGIDNDGDGAVDEGCFSDLLEGVILTQPRANVSRENVRESYFSGVGFYTVYEDVVNVLIRDLGYNTLNALQVGLSWWISKGIGITAPPSFVDNIFAFIAILFVIGLFYLSQNEVDVFSFFKNSNAKDVAPKPRRRRKKRKPIKLHRRFTADMIVQPQEEEFNDSWFESIKRTLFWGG